MFAPESSGVDYGTAVRQILAGGPYESGDAGQYVAAFETVIRIVADRRLDDRWGEGLDPSWMGEMDQAIADDGCSFRFSNVLFRDQNVYGLPISRDVPLVSRVSRLEASGIVLEAENVSLSDPEGQEALELFVASCREVASSECEMIVFYS